MISRRVPDAALLLVLTCSRPSRSSAAAHSVPMLVLARDDYVGFFETDTGLQRLFVGRLYESGIHMFIGRDRWEDETVLLTEEDIQQYARDLSYREQAWFDACRTMLKSRRDAERKKRGRHIQDAQL